jgi:iron complex transport system ATP-binding protein
MVEIRNISFSYGRNEVVKNVSLNVRQGEFVGILGNNGSGKSTLINCLNKILAPKTGSLYIHHQDVFKMNRLEISQRISYVAQHNEISQITVFDSILLGRKPYIRWVLSPKDLEICDAIIKRLNLSEFKMRYLDELSGGELQKVMLARALVQQPQLLLLDEPTSNLDPKNQHEILSLVKKVATEQKISVLMVLHDINLALRYCDKFLFLKAGSVCKYGDISSITEETLTDVYGIDAVITAINGQKIVIIE